jgi:uncharacterized iron-regulated membrane protein
MKGGVRQSMSWLHGWSGLLLGWLLFAIFVTGTIAYFRQEVTLWMQPELHGSVPSPRAAEIGLAKLAEVAPQASSWTVNLPSDRSDTVRISWRNEDESRRGGERGRAERRERGSESQPRAAQGQRGRNAPERQRGGGRGGRERNGLTLDATTGEVLKPRETAGGNFLYRFHFELYALPRDWARWIVGIAPWRCSWRSSAASSRTRRSSKTSSRSGRPRDSGAGSTRTTPSPCLRCRSTS